MACANRFTFSARPPDTLCNNRAAESSVLPARFMPQTSGQSNVYWLAAALVLCLVAGLLRVVPLLTHEPLVALANSYDEVRYTACFDLYPDRADAVEPTQNSPEAPYS